MRPGCLVPALLLTLNSGPSAGHPPLGKREVEKAMKKMGEVSDAS